MWRTYYSGVSTITVRVKGDEMYVVEKTYVRTIEVLPVIGRKYSVKNNGFRLLVIDWTYGGSMAENRRGFNHIRGMKRPRSVFVNDVKNLKEGICRGASCAKNLQALTV